MLRQRFCFPSEGYSNVAGVITRAWGVSVWERQNAFSDTERFVEEIRFGVSLFEARGTGPTKMLIASCCEKVG